MADTPGMADNRGIDISKAVKGFGEIQNVFKKYLTVRKVGTRENRWFQKTAGFLDSTDSAGVTATQIITSVGSIPVAIEPSWTRNTTQTIAFKVQSPLINIEDLKDNDTQIWTTIIRDLTRALQRQVDTRIYNTISENQSAVNINSVTATSPWNHATQSGVTIIKDILSMQEQLFKNGYDPMNAVIAMQPFNYKWMLTNLIETKGSSIPEFASRKMTESTYGTFNLLGNTIIVSENVASGSLCMWIPSRSAEWLEFMGLSSAVIDDPGIGRIYRIWEEGEAILTDPKSVCLLTNINV